MAFDLSAFFGKYMPVNAQNNNVQMTGNVSNGSPSASEMMTLLPGQTLQGEIVSMQGNQVQLLIGNDFLLNASLDNRVDINIGQLMNFQVKSISSSLISLVPLSINMTMDENAMKALNESGLPVTDQTVEMVNSLMKEGMPIDKETLLNVHKELLAFPKTEPESIVQMMRLKIPLTEENIEQFAAYKNYNHKLSDGVMELQNQLSALFQTAGKGAAQGLEGSREFLRQILAFFGENAKQLSQTGDGVVLKAGSEGNAFGEITEETITEATMTEETKTEETKAEGIQQGKEAVVTKTIANAAKSIQTMQPEEVQTQKEAVQPAGQEAEGSIEGKEVLNPAEKQTFLSLLKEIGTNPETIQLFQNGQINVKQLAAMLEAGHLEGKQLSKLFSSREFGKLLQNEMTEQLLIRPEQVTKDEVEEYYTNLKNQTTKLLQLLESTGRGDSPAAKTLQNMNRNVDFLNQLNQMYSYVQFPLKMEKDAAHGDLYVYTNKKNLARKDGSVSALLHLDMPHLGMLDVYVAMQEENVSTKFYIQDESVMDFLEQHMESLTDRLKKRGYQASAQVVLREKTDEKTVMEEILKQEKNVPEMMKIGMRSFDVRA